MPTIDVPVQTPVNQYTANPSQTVFAYTFLLFSNADVQVIVDGVTKTLTTDYTVSGVLNEAGGNITFGVGLTGGESVTIKRKTSIGRDSQYQADGTFDAAPLERDLDKLVTIAQELRRDADAAVKLNIADLTSSGELPLPAANKALVWSGSAPYSLVNGPTAGDIANAATNAATATTKAAEAAASAAAAAASALETDNDVIDYDTATPATGDFIPFADIDDGNTKKKATVANILALSAPDVVLLSTQTVSAPVASINFTSGISGAYGAYRFIGYNLTAATSGVLQIRFSVDNGANWLGSNYSYAFAGYNASPSADSSGGTSAAAITGGGSSMGSAGRSTTFDLVLFDPSETVNEKRIAGVLSRADSGGGGAGVVVRCIVGSHSGTAAINAIQFYGSAGNINAGTIKMYGIK